MKQPFSRRQRLYFILAEICNLILCLMLAYCRIGHGEVILTVSFYLLFFLVVLPSAFFMWTWMLDVFFREIIGGLIHRREHETAMQYIRRILRMPNQSALEIASIIQIMCTCVIIGAMIWPVLRKATFG